MKSIILKSTMLWLMTIVMTFSLTPIALGLNSPLDDIKSKLESEGIDVIDYSNPNENPWGSLPESWIGVLESLGSSSLADFAEDMKPDFEDLQTLRLERDQMEAEKARAPAGEDRDLLNENLFLKQADIQLLEDQIRTSIADKLSADSLGLSATQITEGANLLMNEIDFMLNSSRWGGLPSPIISRLLEGKTKFNDLSELQSYLQLESDTGSQEDILVGLGFSLDEATTIMEEINALRFRGERQLNEVALTIAITLRNLIGGLAVLWIVISGIRMVLDQGDETVIEEQKRSIFWALIGLISIILIERTVNILYGAPGIQRLALGEGTAAFSNEVLGLVHFIEALMGTIAIFMIIISGIRTIVAQGEADEISKQRHAVLYIIAGLLLTALDEVVVKNFFIIPTQQQYDQIKQSNVVAIINTVGNVTKFALTFVGIIALGALIYGAGMMVTNFGDEEATVKAKAIVKNAVIGIIIILSAYTIVATLISFK